MKDGAQEVTGQERTHDRYNDIDQKVRSVMHDFRGNPADHCCNDQIDD
jgi:hypothetical protein